jgi:hypothetical protein
VHDKPIQKVEVAFSTLIAGIGGITAAAEFFDLQQNKVPAIHCHSLR